MKDEARLQHILDAIALINIYMEEGKRDSKTKAAIERQIITIGEAVRYISPELKECYPLVPWQDIIGMRNIIIHEYFDVDIMTIWDTVEYHIPALYEWINNILNSTNNK